MITVKLQGGLGNQMFQYALGRHLSLKNNSPLALDVSYYNYKYQFAPRQFDLDTFNIQADRKNTGSSFIQRLLFKLKIRLKFTRYIKESSVEFSAEILNLAGDIYLDGFWQSEKYFLAIKDTLQSDFVFKKGLNGANLLLANQIDACNAVSVHIRRGDYINGIPTYKDIFSLNYYQKAVQSITEQVKDPVFFIFSDDMTWVKGNLQLPLAYFVDHNQSGAGHLDLQLMSLCKHHIIANSTFSWWGAWLSTHVNKVVVAPANWFNDQELITGDLLPANWQRI